MLAIRELRKAKGMTLDELADMAGTSKGYLSQIETGKRTPSIPMLRAVAEALGHDPAEFMMQVLPVALAEKLAALDEDGRRDAERYIDFLIERSQHQPDQGTKSGQ